MIERHRHCTWWWPVAATVALITACAGSPDGSGSEQTPAGQQTSSGPEQVAAVFDELVEGDTVGVYEDLRAVLVLVGGRPLVERYHDSSAEATSNVASVTKSVISILVGIALDEGDVGSVDQTLSELLPEYAAIMAPDIAGGHVGASPDDDGRVARGSSSRGSAVLPDRGLGGRHSVRRAGTAAG